MPQIAFGQPTWLPDITDALEKVIVAGTKLPADKVFTFYGDPGTFAQNPTADKVVLVGVESLPVGAPYFSGGGAAHTIFETVFRLDAFVRIATDRELQDVKILRDKANGFADFLKSLLKAVQGWYPLVGTTSILKEPASVQGVQMNPRKTATGVAWASVRLRAPFRTDLT